jgi:hypothetical protein
MAVLDNAECWITEGWIIGTLLYCLFNQTLISTEILQAPVYFLVSKKPYHKWINVVNKKNNKSVCQNNHNQLLCDCQ